MPVFTMILLKGTEFAKKRLSIYSDSLFLTIYVITYIIQCVYHSGKYYHHLGKNSCIKTSNAVESNWPNWLRGSDNVLLSDIHE